MEETTLESLVADLMKLEPHEIQSSLDSSLRYCLNDFLLTLASLANSSEGHIFASTIAILDSIINGDLSAITLHTLTQIQEPLLSCLKKQKTRDLSERVAGIVTVVALLIHEAGGKEWTDLLQFQVRTLGDQESANGVRGSGVQESALRVLSSFPRSLFYQLKKFDLPMVRLSILKKANSLDTELESLSIASYAVLLDASDNSIKDEEVQLFLSTVVGSIKKLGCQGNNVVHRRLGLLARIINLRSNLLSESHLAYVFKSMVDVVQLVAEGIKPQMLTNSSVFYVTNLLLITWIK